ncbi:MAG: LuxR C-terminal-related transcriptional regulator, partial [Dehalococcoidia bacterium]|nr:LuxR C-terminal-related transcriptional regulator [Dehalococcoidia bacterium]
MQARWRSTSQAASGLGAVFLWLLLVPLGPVGGALAASPAVWSLGHGIGLAVVARWRWPTRPPWAGFTLALAALTASLASPLPSGVLLWAASGALAAPAVLRVATALGDLAPRPRAWAVAGGAVLANLPLLAVGSLALGLDAARWLGLLAVLPGVAVVSLRRGGDPEPGAWDWRLLPAIGAAYLVGGLTYGVVLPSSGALPLGVLPYLGVLPVAAWVATRVGREAAVRLGLAALGAGLVVWALGFERGTLAIGALLVGAWAFLDVGWWARLGDEPGYRCAYGYGLGAMAGAIGLGHLLVEQATALAGTSVGPLVGAAAVLAAALVLPRDRAALDAVRGRSRERVPGGASRGRAVPEFDLDDPPGELADPNDAQRRATADRPAAGETRGETRRVSRAARERGFHLTQREAAVLERALRGATNKEIAAELGVAPGTVRTHLENAYRKLGVRSRTEALWKLFGSPADGSESE